jgi:CubicO group peptidase (beta-lactamase class C family)
MASLKRHRAVIAVGVMLTAGVAGHAAPATPDDAVKATIAAMPGLLKQWDVPGAGLAIVEDGKVVALKGFGYRDVARKLPVTPDTIFAIGSATKSFTAMAAEMAADDGKFSLDVSPRTYLPGFRLFDPYANAHVTMRDLLSHRTGLPDHGGDIAMALGDTTLTRSDLIRLLAYIEPTAKFRTTFQYNNLGYIAAGTAVAQAEHEPYEQLITKRILRPLGMTETNLDSRQSAATRDYAVGYAVDAGHSTALPMPSDALAGPAGAINSSARDMAKWLAAMEAAGVGPGGQLVSPRGYQELLTPQIAGPGSVVEHYCLGWFQYHWRGHVVYWHGGNIGGFSANIAWIPDLHVGYVLLTNSAMNDSSIGGMDAMWSALAPSATAPETNPTGAPLETATYNVYRGTSAGGESPTPVMRAVSSRRFTDTGLANGTTYFYRVTAVDSAGESKPSPEVSAAPSADAPDYITDDMTDWTAISSKSQDWTFDTTNAAYFNNIPSRATRIPDDTEYLIYKRNGIRTFTARVYTRQGPIDTVKFYVSTDGGATFNPIRVTPGAQTPGDGSWGYYDITPATPLPSGVTDLKLEFNAGTGNAWDPQLSRVTIGYTGTGENTNVVAAATAGDAAAPGAVPAVSAPMPPPELTATASRASVCLTWARADIPPSDAALETGRYPITPAVALTVDEKNGALVLTIPGQGSPTLEHTGDRRYRIAGTPVVVRFRSAKTDPAVTEMVIEANGTTQVFKRDSSGSVATAWKSPITVDALFTNMVAAAGGATHMTDRHTVTTVEDLYWMDSAVHATVASVQMAPHYSSSRFRFTALGKEIGTMHVYYDGVTGGRESAAAMLNGPLTGSALDGMRQAAELFPLPRWKSLYRKAEITGHTRIGGAEAYIVLVTPKQGSPFTDYVSPQTWRVVKTDFADHSTAFADYRLVQGVWTPFRLTQTGSAGTIDITVRSVRFDEPVTMEEFHPSK